MSSTVHKNILFDFLIQPQFRIGRHIVMLTIFAFISLGQSLFMFGEFRETLGLRFPIYVFFNALAIIAFFYYNLYNLTPRLLLKNKYVQYVTVLIAGTAFYIILKSIMEYNLFLSLGIECRFNAVTLLDGLSNLTLYSICIASSSATTLFKQWISDTEKIDKLQNKQLRSRVDEIKSHIHPKSLSNMLVYASEKIKTDAGEASDILYTLGEVLRYELYDCKREKVVLDSDIRFIDKYLSLEQHNRTAPFTYTLHTEGRMDFLVPPFLFMPFVQEILEQYPTHLDLSFRYKGDSLYFKVEVTGTDLSACDFSTVERNRLSLDKPNISFTTRSQIFELIWSV